MTNDTPRCTAHTTSGARCKKAPMKGTTVCRTHGGSAPQVRAAAERRQQEQAAGELLARLVWNPDAEPVVDAVAALQQLAGSERHALDVLGDLVNRWLEQDETCQACGRPATDPPPVLLAALQRQNRQHGRTLGEMERLGIAGRANEIEASKVEVLAVAVVGALDAVSMGSGDRAVFLATLFGGLGVLPPDVVAGEVTA